MIPAAHEKEGYDWGVVLLLTKQSGATGCVKGFVTCFLEVPLACLGSMAAASLVQLPVELSENMLQNLFLNLPPQTVQ